MRAATIRDGRIVIAEHPDPEPEGDQVVVRVEAAGLNAADLLQLVGRYPAPPGSPADIPGLELAGTVAAVGRDARRFAIGDRVMAIVGGGAQAELAVVAERQLMPVPDGLATLEAGGTPEAFTTAHDALFSQCGLRSGERLLVHGAAGGVGTAAVQLGRATGAHVTATVRDPGLRSAVAALGADAVVDPAAFAEYGPFDVVLELVGAVNLATDVQALADDGRIVVIGLGGGARVELDLRDLMAKRGVLRASTLRARPLESKAIAARRVEREVLCHLAAGRLRVPIAASFPLAQAADAYARFAEGSKLGKIVLAIGAPQTPSAQA